MSAKLQDINNQLDGTLQRFSNLQQQGGRSTQSLSDALNKLGEGTEKLPDTFKRSHESLERFAGGEAKLKLTAISNTMLDVTKSAGALEKAAVGMGTQMSGVLATLGRFGGPLGMVGTAFATVAT